MGSHAWEGVMVVVPALAKRQHGEQPIVPAVVSGAERAGAKGMADGIDGVNHLVGEREPNDTTPYEATPACDQIRDKESRTGLHQKRPVDKSQDRITQDVLTVLFSLG